MRALISAFAALVIAGAATPGLAQVATKTNQHSDWATFTYRDDSGPVCYASSVPSAFNPATGVNHGDIFFLITTKPRQNVELEPGFRAAGFEFEQGSKVRVTVGDRTFDMFTDGGWAWVENPAEEPQLVEAMRAGMEMTVRARSARPRDVSYVFSLRGLTAATNEIANCS